jgi:hypothetical protein
MSISFRQHPRTTPRHTHHIHRLDTGKDDDRKQRGQEAPVLDACHSARHRYPIGGRPEHNHDQSTTTESPHHQVPPRGSRHGPLPTGNTHPTARGQLQGAVKEAPKSSPPSWRGPRWPPPPTTPSPTPTPHAGREEDKPGASAVKPSPSDDDEGGEGPNAGASRPTTHGSRDQDQEPPCP